MSDSPSISVSYSTQGQPANQAGPARSAPSSDTPRVAFATCELVPVNAQMTLMINRENGRQQLIAPTVLDALKTCTRFDTVANHARQICQSRPDLSGQEANVSSTLEQLRRSGFLNEASTVCARLNQPVKRDLPPTRVFIVTSDRPEAVGRLLESMLAAGGLTKYEKLFLIDDSKQEESRTANRELVARFNTTSAQDMTYFGREEQASLLKSLLSELPEHEEGIRFLLDANRWSGFATYGRARNLCLALSVGRRAIVLDDDILCRAIRPAVPEEGIVVGGDGNREASFFPNRDELMQMAMDVGESPLDLHARFLGQHVGATIQALNDGDLRQEQLTGSNAAMASIWRPESRILVSQCGSWGDPGTGDAHWTLGLSEFSISRLLTAPQGVKDAIENRCVWLGEPRPAIIKIAIMSQMTGLDNSALLPPYFPAFRGEDLLFGSMVEATHPHDAVINHGFAVPHLPEERVRKTIRDPIANAGSVGVFAAYLVNKIDYADGNDPAHRLAIQADDFRRLAAKSTDDLLLDYRREVAKAHAALLHRLTTQLGATRDINSANWTGYLERGVSEMQEALQREWSPTDIDGAPADATKESMIDAMRGMLRGYAAGLDAWPELRTHCAATETIAA